LGGKKVAKPASTKYDEEKEKKRKGGADATPSERTGSIKTLHRKGFFPPQKRLAL